MDHVVLSTCLLSPLRILCQWGWSQNPSYVTIIRTQPRTSTCLVVPGPWAPTSWGRTKGIGVYGYSILWIMGLQNYLAQRKSELSSEMWDPSWCQVPIPFHREHPDCSIDIGKPGRAGSSVGICKPLLSVEGDWSMEITFHQLLHCWIIGVASCLQVLLFWETSKLEERGKLEPYRYRQ